ncbi:hypothetical protein PBAT_02050 [Paenibacillus antarcticus]|uniref:TraD/TraG TraM recognition site domain-containing protein n=2 Tax=Paenibacillus antarcticus TaxID=253703 RepID=A0A168R0K5_9BACL|nr:hypothetical protein PBAT_02050 [Paenibacillus antarcticus]
MPDDKAHADTLLLALTSLLKSEHIGIVNRLNVLKKNVFLELMLKKDTTKNIDLSIEMHKNQLIIIRMPEVIFLIPEERDIATTYWMSKVMLSLQVRASRIPDRSKRTKVNLVVDEIYEVAHTEQYLTFKLYQVAKFVMKPIISCHYINQLTHMRQELRNANTSYILVAGRDKDNFKELKEELYPIVAEDLMNRISYTSFGLYPL